MSSLLNAFDRINRAFNEATTGGKDAKPGPQPPQSQQSVVGDESNRTAEKRALFGALRSATKAVIAAAAEGRTLAGDSPDAAALATALLGVLRHGLRQFRGARLLGVSTVVELSGALRTDAFPPRDLRECTVEAVRDSGWVSACLAAHVMSAVLAAVPRDCYEPWALLNDPELAMLCAGLLAPLDDMCPARDEPQLVDQLVGASLSASELPSAAAPLLSPAPPTVPTTTTVDGDGTQTVHVQSRKTRRRVAKVAVLDGESRRTPSPTASAASTASAVVVAKPSSPQPHSPVSAFKPVTVAESNARTKPPSPLPVAAVVVDGEEREGVSPEMPRRSEPEKPSVPTTSKPPEPEKPYVAPAPVLTEPTSPETKPTAKSEAMKEREPEAASLSESKPEPQPEPVSASEPTPEAVAKHTPEIPEKAAAEPLGIDNPEDSAGPVADPLTAFVSHPLGDDEEHDDDFELVNEGSVDAAAAASVPQRRTSQGKDIYPETLSVPLERRVIKVVCRADAKAVRYLELTFSDGRVVCQGATTKGDERCFYLGENEYIVEVSGRRTPRSQVLAQITFRTNRGTTFGPMGGQGVTTFTDRAAPYQYLFDIEIQRSRALALRPHSLGGVKVVWRALPGARVPVVSSS